MSDPIQPAPPLSTAALAHLQQEASEHPKFHRTAPYTPPAGDAADAANPAYALVCTPTGAAPAASGAPATSLPPPCAPVPAPQAIDWKRTPVPFNPSTMLQLTDGRILCQSEMATDWWILTPSATGSYSGGTWSQAASMSKARLYYTSAVLIDGRVLVAGGESFIGAQSEDNTAEIYDPAKNSWTTIPAPNWPYVGDAPCTTLPDGRVLMGSIVDDQTAIFDPKSNTWSDGGTKLAPSAEESWVALPDGSVLTVDCDPSRKQQSELWVPGTGGGKWIDAGKIPVSLVEDDSEEIGAGMQLPDGRVFFLGATGHSAFYHPSKTAGQPGTWSAGPDLPIDASGRQVVAKDAPAVMLPNGHLLFVGASVINPDDYGSATSFFEFDPKCNKITSIAAPPLATDAFPQAPYEGRFMLMPNGEAAFVDGSSQVSYFPVIKPTNRRKAPTLLLAPPCARAGTTISVAGQRFNGSSQGVAYGDDAAAATNYPLARLISTSGKPGEKKVYYATTTGFSMGVATGKDFMTTKITIPADIPPGKYRLQIVANASGSNEVPITVTAAPAPSAR